MSSPHHCFALVCDPSFATNSGTTVLPTYPPDLPISLHTPTSPTRKKKQVKKTKSYPESFSEINRDTHHPRPVLTTVNPYGICHPWGMATCKQVPSVLRDPPFPEPHASSLTPIPPPPYRARANRVHPTSLPAHHPTNHAHISSSLLGAPPALR